MEVVAGPLEAKLPNFRSLAVVVPKLNAGAVPKLLVAVAKPNPAALGASLPKDMAVCSGLLKMKLSAEGSPRLFWLVEGGVAAGAFRSNLNPPGFGEEALLIVGGVFGFSEEFEVDSGGLMNDTGVFALGKSAGALEATGVANARSGCALQSPKLTENFGVSAASTVGVGSETGAAWDTIGAGRLKCTCLSCLTGKAPLVGVADDKLDTRGVLGAIGVVFSVFFALSSAI